MTELLIKLFVKNNKDTKNTKVRLAYGNLAGIVGILCNVLLFAGKYIIGTLFGSIAIAADAVNNLSDASSNIVSLLGFKLGSKKADEEHPYGHARYEYLAGLVVCVIIVAIGFESHSSVRSGLQCADDRSTSYFHLRKTVDEYF